MQTVDGLTRMMMKARAGHSARSSNGTLKMSRRQQGSPGDGFSSASICFVTCMLGVILAVELLNRIAAKYSLRTIDNLMNGWISHSLILFS